MSLAVVVVGPTTIGGVGNVDPELASVALDGIDDGLALVGERVVAVDQVWREVLQAAVGHRRDGVVLVCPSWWARARLERVGAAARSRYPNVTVRRRADVLASDLAVVEVGPELVVVQADAHRRAVARVGPSEGVIGAVAAQVDGLGSVTVDVPAGLGAFGTDLVRALRRRAIVVTVVDDRAIVRAVQAQHADVVVEPAWWRRITPRAAVLAGAVSAAIALAAAAVGAGGGSFATGDQRESTWLVEGRVAVEIPAQWAVERITSGPGSARVQVMSPTDRWAILLTQSRVPADQTLDMAAETLRLALADEPDGVFVDFTTAGRRGERPVITYREIRPEHHVAWAVMLDHGVRIAVGCQGAPGGAGPEQVCDRAIRTAHALASK